MARNARSQVRRAKIAIRSAKRAAAPKRTAARSAGWALCMLCLDAETNHVHGACDRCVAWLDAGGPDADGGLCSPNAL
jgi:hypothetical protein